LKSQESETIESNHLSEKVINDDIRNIDFKSYKNKVDGVIGGPPCPPFSQSRHYLQHKKNGFLAKPYDANDFANGISWIITNQLSNDDLSINCRNIAINNFNITSVANKHIELYQKVMSSI
jgi:hypothetical protein